MGLQRVGHDTVTEQQQLLWWEMLHNMILINFLKCVNLFCTLTYYLPWRIFHVHLRRKCILPPVCKLCAERPADGLMGGSVVCDELLLPFCFPDSIFIFQGFFFFPFIFISWRLITLQYCSGFCHTLTWISHGFICIPHPNHPLPPPSPPDPSGSSQCTRPEHLSHASHLGWWSVSP